MSNKSKNAINNALSCIQQYTTTTTYINGGWVNLGRLQTRLRSYHMKMELSFSEGDVKTGSLLSQDSMYNGNMLIAHFITSHSQYLSQPAFDNTQFYASCNCYQYENITDTIFRVVQNNSNINIINADALYYNLYMYVGKTCWKYSGKCNRC